jgi:membrane fusion protein, macrolide-specific efflux system
VSLKWANQRWVLNIGAAVAVSFTLGFFWNRTNDDSKKFDSEQVKRGELKITIDSTGVVAPENRVDVKAPIPGRIEEVLVDEGDEVSKGKVLAWMSSTERAALLDSARSKSHEEYQHWLELYKPTPILAPITGTLILRGVQPGQTFTSTDSIFAISDRLAVQAQVDETDLPMVKVNSPATIILDAYPEKIIPAEVVRIAFDAKTVSNVTTFVVNVVPLKIPKFMRSGMTANVYFEILSRKDVLLVRNAALVPRGRASTVLRKRPGFTEEILVKLGATDGKVTEVLSGLHEGDNVLVPKLIMNRAPAANPLSNFFPDKKKRGN